VLRGTLSSARATIATRTANVEPGEMDLQTASEQQHAVKRELDICNSTLTRFMTVFGVSFEALIAVFLVVAPQKQEI
jgi:hypothetical protein